MIVFPLGFDDSTTRQLVKDCISYLEVKMQTRRVENIIAKY